MSAHFDFGSTDSTGGQEIQMGVVFTSASLSLTREAGLWVDLFALNLVNY